MRRFAPGPHAAFTLIELSIVVLVLSLLAAAAISYSQAQTNANNLIKLNAQLDVIENDIINYVNVNGRLPCPAPWLVNETSANFGVEEGTTPGDGTCVGTTGSVYFNTTTDPDGPGGTDPGAPDPLYTPNASYFAGNVAGGILPTKTLMLPDDYGFDPWGRQLVYAVDKRMTATGATATYSIYDTTIGNIAIKVSATDALSNAITNQAVYAIISFGPNGHGGYVRNLGSGTTQIYSPVTDSNVDEAKNCHCAASTGAPANFDRIFVQRSKLNSADTFDDIVRFKTRANIINSGADLQ